jgi:hypothetical protein
MDRSLAALVVGYGIVPGSATVGGLVLGSRAGLLPVSEGWVMIALLHGGGLLAYVSSKSTLVRREAYQVPTGGMDEARSRQHHDGGYFAAWPGTQTALFVFSLTVAAVSGLGLVTTSVR